LRQSLLVGGERRLAQFAVQFVLVGVGNELVEQAVGTDDFNDVICSQEWHQAFLPIVVSAFDFAFCLGCGGVEQFDAIEVEGLAKLGESVGVVSVKEGVVVHVKGQWQAMGLKNAGEKIEVGEQGFSGIEARAGIQAGGIIENVQKDLLVGAAGQPRVRRGIVLPERAVIAGLPAFDGFGRGFVAGIRGELVLDGPAADAGTVGFEMKAAEQFTGDGAVGARRFGGEEFGDQSGDFGGPLRMVIATGESGRPGLRVAGGGGAEVLGVKFMEAGTCESQFAGSSAGADLAGAITVEEMTDERNGQSFDQLWFFIGPKITEEDGFFALRLETAGACRTGEPARPAVCKPSDGAQVASPQCPILR
jgi:hypothetical protein